jgi:glycosyltransferase involved in cell wall biosynthesis
MRFVGDGPMRPVLEREIERRGLTDRVTMSARLPSADVPDLLRRLAAVILPSVTTHRWKEQFGRILVEAMACGVPVIGSDSGEIPRVIGNAGLVVPEGDVAALAAAMRQLYDDQCLRRDLAERGRQRSLSHFTHGQVAARTLEAYQAALSA